MRYSKMCARVLTLLLVVLGAGGAQATAVMEGITPAELFPWSELDPQIPTLVDTVGVVPGARPIRHAELMHYLTVLAEASPRARLIEYSRTHEGRALVYFAVSDAQTVARLDQFKEDHARVMDPRDRPAAQDAALLATDKAVAWMAYGIHGDELSSVDAAAALAYWLVAGEDERATTLRSELVILIDPIQNPDGRERSLAQTSSFAHAIPTADQEDLSHTTVWPWGRGNHYLFDMNRDWFSMVQPESRRSIAVATWNPQLIVDSHEMGANSSYLFPPPRHPFNPHLPSHHDAWLSVFSGDQASALDARGYSYFTGEWNEEFFPGYGSSWASYMGAVGILYEMSRTSGTLVRKRSGEIRTYPQAVEHQVTSSVANLETLATHADKILNDFLASRREAVANMGGNIGAWVLPRGHHPERTDALVTLLRKQGIDVLAATSHPPQISGLHDSMTGSTVKAASLPEDNWIVPLNQPLGPLIRVLLDPHVPMNAEFFREEREYIERGKGSRLYEITAWSMPLCYGIEAYWTEQVPASGWEDRPVVEASGGLKTATDALGYLMEGNSDRSTSALAGMLQAGIAVKVAEKPFQAGEVAYEPGALLIDNEGNGEDLEQQLMKIAKQFAVHLEPKMTALSPSGPDLGGSHFKPLVAPRVGIWSGFPVSPSAYGALWHLFDQQLLLRFTGLDIGRFGAKDLDRYNVLIFPPAYGGSSAYRQAIGEAGLKKLKSWIEAGGTAIGIGGGAEFLADKDSELTKTRLRRQALETFPPVVLGPGPLEAQQAGRFRAAGISAPEDTDDTDDIDDAVTANRSSPYDVAPILGAGAIPFAVGHDQGTPVTADPVDLADWVKPYLAPGKSKPELADLKSADRRLRLFSSRGAFLRVELDPEAWLAWGVQAELPALSRAQDTLVAVPPVQVVARFADLERLHLGGLLWPEAAGRLAHTAYLTREGLGRGQVILFLNEPGFRGWTLGTRRLLTNAILYGPGLGTRWSTPW
jgi:hypothetical protein